MSNPYLIPRPASISFSGGRTSGYMLWKILRAYKGKLPDDVIVTFANTGKEVEETLEFVRDCSEWWDVPIRWVEYCRDPSKPILKPDCGQMHIGCHSFREVTFATASRQGEPFRALIEVKADFRREAKNEPPVLPNPPSRWCSGELKARTMERLLGTLGFDEFTTAVGIRADEAKRADSLHKSSTSKHDFVCPLVDAGVVLADVLSFWKEQSFDLKLQNDPVFGTYEGNCDLCFLKKTAKIKRLLAERPEAFDWWAEQEDFTGQTFRRDRPSYGQMKANKKALEVCGDEDQGTCMCTD